jgi:hypothetical protein
VCQNSADRLSGSPIVVVEDPTQLLVPFDIAIHIGHASTSTLKKSVAAMAPQCDFRKVFHDVPAVAISGPR